MDPIVLAIVSIIVGFGIGILSGLLGVGGGTIMIPVFRLGYGLSATVATATSLFTIIPTSASGLIQHAREKTLIPKLGILMGLGGACTSVLGVELANISPGWLIMIVAALIIAYSAYNMLAKVFKAKSKEEKEQLSQVKEELPPRPEIKGKASVQGVVIGLVAGVMSGYVGVGGGFLMVPMMLNVMKIPMVYASGTSLIGITLLAIPAAIVQIVLGHVEFTAGIAIAVGTIPGALVGAHLVKLVPERTLRLIFGAMLFIASILLVVNEFGLLG